LGARSFNSDQVLRSGLFDRAGMIRYTDLNRDGRLDAVWRQVLTDNSSDKIWMALNNPSTNGGAGFTLVSNHIADVADALDNDLFGNDPDRQWGLLDVNGDGTEDLITTESVASNNQPPWARYVRLANGAGGFASARTILAGTSTFIGPATVGQFAFTDSSGDGIQDLLYTENTGTGALLKIARGQLSSTGEMSFSAGQTVSLQFTGEPQPTTCYNVAFGKRHKADNWDSLDFNGDASADLVLRVQQITPCPANRGAGLNYAVGLDATAPVVLSSKETAYSSTNPMTNPTMWGIFVASSTTTFVETYRGVGVAEVEGALRIIDLNGDGLNDLVSQSNSFSSWGYQLNQGGGKFGALYCLIPQATLNPDLINCRPLNSPNGNTNADLYIADYDLDGYQDVWIGEADPVNQLGGGSGPPGRRYKVQRWVGASVGSCNSNTGNCSDFAREGIWTHAVSGNYGDWRTSFADLDADGFVDLLSYKNAGSSNTGYVISRSIYHHQPRDMVSSVTSGFDSTTSFTYSPSTYLTSYTRDYDGVATRNWGRGSVIVDAPSVGYVVTAMTTPAPTAENANQMAIMRYRYMGMKMQGGGRGGLGYRKIFTLNVQNSVETATEYAQQFPLTGRPLSTESRALSATGLDNWTLSCNPDSAGADACFKPQPVCTAGSCAHFSGNDANPGARGQILQRSVDVHQWRTRGVADAEYAAAVNPALPATPVITFPYSRTSTSFRHESSTELANVVIASTVNDMFVTDKGVEKSYDSFGNLIASSTRHYTGVPGVTADYEVKTANSYTNDTSTWTLGRLTRSDITHIRPGDSKVRSSEFAYETNGQLKMERVQPGDAALQLTKYTFRDSYGQPTTTISCSMAVETAGNCTTSHRPSNEPASDQVYRYARVVNDVATGLPIQSYVLANQNGTAVERLASSSTLNKWGGAEIVTTTDAPTVTNTYDLMGRLVHTYASTGGQASTLMSYCTGVVPGVTGVSCPANAVTRVESKSPHAPSSWSYSDKLGRGIASVSEQLKKGNYTVVRSGYDNLGRQIWQSEPNTTLVGPAVASTLPTSGLIRTESCYDVGGRVIYLKLPNHTQAFSCASPPAASVITSTTPNDGNNVIQTIYTGLTTETINGMGQAQKVTANAMGETVRSEDAAGTKTEFTYDALGNLRTTTRGVGTSSAMTTTMSYDIMGRRTSLDDLDTGLRRSYFNAVGESIREVDAKSQCMQNDLDFNGRVIRTTEFNTWNSANTQCSGTAGKRTFAKFDGQQLGKLDSSSYGTSDSPAEAGSVSTRIAYDSLGRAVSTERCIRAVAIGQGIAADCKVEQQSFDQYGRAYWAADASSENLIHGSNPYAGSGVRRGVRMQYSGATTTVNGVAFNAHFMIAQTKLGDDASHYYQVYETNARGQVTRERVAGKDMFISTRSYEDSTGRLLGLNTGSLQNLTVQYDELGNLRKRSDLSNGRNIVESSTNASDYDVLNRIKQTSLTVGGVARGSLTMAYSVDGNITSKVGTDAYSAANVGSYNYGSTVTLANCNAGSNHAVRAIGTLGYCYDANGNQTQSLDRSTLAPKRLISYANFDKPLQMDSYEVSGAGHSTRYGYGPAREMAYRLDIPQYAGLPSNATLEVHYFGSVERELRREGSNIRETYKRMIGGALQVVEERVISAGSTTVALGTLREEVMLKDHLGSTHVIVNMDGTNPQYQRFDVWGMRADATTGSTQTLSQSYQTNNPADATKTRTRKGFTGHEMVDGAGIVHMQGRIYDPLLGRFLQADPIVQDPLNAQSYNRYTYVFNNPLSLTDPSGYRSLSANLELYWKPILTIYVAVTTGIGAQQLLAAGEVLLAATVAVYGGATVGLINTGTLRGTVTGAFQGLATFGIGHYIPLDGNALANISAHMMLGGLVEEMNGGDFGHGFASAGLSKIIGLGIDRIGDSDPLKIVLQGIAGGAIAEAEGGDFANGAASFALQFAFNQALGGLEAGDDTSVALVVVTENSKNDSGDWSDAAAGAISVVKSDCPKCVIARTYAANTDQFENALSAYVNISRVYVIGHSSEKGVFFGAGRAKNSNLVDMPDFATPRARQLLPNNPDKHVGEMNWGNLASNGTIHIWGCNSGRGQSSIAQSIANYSGRDVVAFPDFVVFDRQSGAHVRWWNGADKPITFRKQQ
jgi:RHS repeat-associated protein